MRDRIHDIELHELVSNQMKRPTSKTFGCLRTGNHRDIRFDLIVEYNRSSNTRVSKSAFWIAFLVLRIWAFLTPLALSLHI
jgi:hypothetical protein